MDKNFVTATSGTGTRGTFDFTTGDVLRRGDARRLRELRRGRLADQRGRDSADRRLVPTRRTLSPWPTLPGAARSAARSTSRSRTPAGRAAAGRASSTSRAARSRRTCPDAVDDDPYAAQTVDVEESSRRSSTPTRRPSDEVEHAAGVRGQSRGVRGTEAALAAARARHRPDRLRDLPSGQVRGRRQPSARSSTSPDSIARVWRRVRSGSDDLEPAVAAGSGTREPPPRRPR